MDAKLDTKLANYNEKLETILLKWKSEIIDSVDALSKEIRDEREFRSISSHQTASNARRIEKLEKKVFGVVGNAV